MTDPDPATATWLAALREDGIRLVEALDPLDEREAEVRERILTHLSTHPDAWWRQGPPAHLTASVLVTTPAHDRVLLTHHRRARTWFQLGGHAELADGSVHAAAAREAREESGLDDLLVLPHLVDVDIHDLHGDFVHCRQHLDLRFVAITREARPRISDESLDVAWWRVDALPDPHGEELPRLIANARLRS